MVSGSSRLGNKYYQSRLRLLGSKALHMKLLLLGSNGQLGWELQRSLSPLSKIFSCDHNTVDFNDFDSL